MSTNHEASTPQHEKTLVRTAVQIRTTRTGGESVLGSGVIYRTSDESHHVYVLSALHCFQGPRTDGKYPFSVDSISRIELGFLLSGNSEPSGFQTLERDALIVDPRLDLAILKVPRQCLLRIDEIPRINIFHHAKPLAPRFDAMGFPRYRGGKRQRISFRTNDGHDLSGFQVKSDLEFSGEDGASDLAGFSGSGLFVSNSNDLIGIVISVPTNPVGGATASLFEIQRLEPRYLNRLLEATSADLPRFPAEKGARFELGLKGEVAVDYERFPIEGIELNLWRAVGRLKSDVQDDWFPDPLGFRDLLTTSAAVELLRDYANDPTKVYEPSPANVLHVPKKGLTTRTAVVSTLADRIVFQALVDEIAERTGPYLVPQVYSCRHNTDPRDGENHLFFDPIEQWKKFQEQIAFELCDENPYLVCTDISSYFDRISFNVLRSRLTDLVNDTKPGSCDRPEKNYEKIIDLTIRFLERWAPSTELANGIPQNRDASSFLANSLLHYVDVYMTSRYKYFRYMDDIRVVCKSEGGARHAIAGLEEKLALLGVHLNAAKTGILHYKKDEGSIHPFLPSGEYIFEQIDNFLRSGRARPVQIAVMLTQRLFRQTLETRPEEDHNRERKLRFCIERLSRFAAQPFLAPLIDWSPILDAVMPMFEDQPWITDVLVRLLKAIGGDALDERHYDYLESMMTGESDMIYDWQAYHIWQLLGFFGVSRPSLLRAAQELVTSPRGDRMPITAGACLYLASVDLQTYRATILDSFNDGRLTGLLCERAGVIALRNVDAAKIIWRRVSPGLDAAHKRLGPHSGPHPYISPLRKIDLRQILRDMPEVISPAGL